ncbi:RNA-directed DNA polymerase, eukaryota, reverse transcriptase zinc-binding domain protein [Tanacetum coccineum]
MGHSSLTYSLRRIPRGGIEQLQMDNLMSNLEGYILPNMHDRWRWYPFHANGNFHGCASVRNLIDDKILDVVGSKTRWNKYVPIKINILAWRLKLDKLPSRLNLSRRGLELDSITCPSCSLAVESTNHIFFGCSMAKELYKFIARWWDIAARQRICTMLENNSQHVLGRIHFLIKDLLCSKLEANLAKFERTSNIGDKKSNNDKERNKAEKINLAGKVNRGTNAQMKVSGREDVSNLCFGRVKEFASLANLKVAICNEGFEEINISYMGELWVKLDFKLVESIKKFKENLKYCFGTLQESNGPRYSGAQLSIGWKGERAWQCGTGHGSNMSVEELERDVSREEVKRAVWDCGVEKSPGPDGFTFGFYRRYWNLIEEDVFKAVVWFFHHGMIPAGGSVYKVIAKILANRLVTVLEDIVSESQSAFVKDRQILDGPPYINELLQWFYMLHSKEWLMAGLFSGIRLDNSTCISHLFYADDAIFMGQWKSSNIENITRVLDIFHKASGLRINMAKSKLLGVSVDHNRVDQAVRRIGFTVLKMPFNYLGSQVGSLMSRTMSWNEVLERMTNRLSRWKLKTISIGGRLTLLKSILGSTPLYHMSMFRVPKQVLQQMERIRARFFNGTDIKSKKISWVSWKRTMASRDTGGIGVASLFALNRALMFKWVWRFFVQNKSLWVRVIKAIHGQDGKIGKKVCVSYPSAWLNIVKEMGVMQAKGIDILNYMKLKCGDGTSISFWKDIWRDEVAFKDLYPRLYMLENMKEVTVAHKLAQEDLEWSFRRKVRSGCEMQQLNSLKAKIEGVILNNSSDRWTWSLEGSGEFSVSSLRKEIDSVYLPQSGKKTRWIKQVPIKVNILAWKVSNDYLPTRVNLSKRGMEIESILCPMCNLSAESACHLFFQCETSRQIFNKICRWWELEIQAINSYEEWVVWMVNIRLRSNSKSAFEGIWYIAWWTIWNVRNNILFGQDNRTQNMIFDDITSRSFFWIKSRCNVKFSWVDWLNAPHLIPL